MVLVFYRGFGNPDSGGSGGNGNLGLSVPFRGGTGKKGSQVYSGRKV